MLRYSKAIMCPTSDRDQFGFVFVTLARRWRRAVDIAISAAGLTDATWAPLVHLSRSGDGVSQTELAGRIGLDTSSLVRLLDLLAEKELLERRVDPDDRRARRIVLTPAGEAEVSRIRHQLAIIERQLLADLTDDEIAAMMTGFAHIASRAEAMLEAEKPAQ